MAWVEILLKKMHVDFPGSPGVKNLPSNVGDLGLIPGQGTKIPHGGACICGQS